MAPLLSACGGAYAMRKFFVACGGSTTQLHRDGFDNLFVVVAGRPVAAPRAPWGLRRFGPRFDNGGIDSILIAPAAEAQLKAAPVEKVRVVGPPHERDLAKLGAKRLARHTSTSSARDLALSAAVPIAFIVIATLGARL